MTEGGGVSAQALVTGTVVGYDPGGNGRHGLARLAVRDGVVESVVLSTHASAEAVLGAIGPGNILAVGVDTLTCWSTGPGGWRPSDRWLRARYPEVRPSVAAPNSLYGSMSLGGMAVLLALRGRQPGVVVTEAHPKVLRWARWHQHYDYGVGAQRMDAELGVALGVDLSTANDHEWDAAASALVALHALRDDWPRDLHALDPAADERLVHPCGPTRYVWPE